MSTPAPGKILHGTTWEAQPNGDKARDGLQPWPQRMLPAFFAKALPSNWEHVTVNKQVESITMPKWVASAFLIAILAFMAQSWWARAADHDAMIRIETRLEDTQKALDKKEAQDKAYQGDMQAWKDIMNGNMKTIQGMLTQAQLDRLEKQQHQ
jgi:hypothetical protein